MAATPESVKKWKLVRQMRGSGCLDDTRAEQIAWLLGDGRTPEEVQAHFKLSSGEYQAITATDLFQRRLTYLTNKNKRKVKLPTTPDECLAFAKRSLVRLSKSADSDKTKVDALKALATVAIDERKNGAAQAPVTTATDSALLDVLSGGK